MIASISPVVVTPACASCGVPCHTCVVSSLDGPVCADCRAVRVVGPTDGGRGVILSTPSRLGVTGDDGHLTYRRPANCGPRLPMATHAGETRSLNGWGYVLGIHPSTMRMRARVYGLDDPRTWHVGRLPTNVPRRAPR